MGLSSSLERGHEGHIREVLQEDSFSNMYNNLICSTSCNVIYSRNMLQFRSGNLIRNTDWCLFFCRLKINHDFHELILESGSIVKSYSKCANETQNVC
jgi:hypothetical protein